MNKYLKIFIAVVACATIGYLSGTVTRESITTWYPTLIKPVFNPPNAIFAPVWTTLYLMMGFSAGLIWIKIDENKNASTKALLFFSIQLALNALWSYLFFGLHNPLLSLVEIIILWLMIYETIALFKPLNKTAAFLLYPYLAWVSFATILNASIWWLNR